MIFFKNAKKHGLGDEKPCFYLSNSMVFEKHDFNEQIEFFCMLLSWATPCHDLDERITGFIGHNYVWEVAERDEIEVESGQDGTNFIELVSVGCSHKELHRTATSCLRKVRTNDFTLPFDELPDALVG